MKKRTTKTRGFGLLAVTLLLPLLFNIQAVHAQEQNSRTDREEITPENIQDLKLLHWFGQGAFSGSLAQSNDGETLAALTTSGVALLDPESGRQKDFIPVGLAPTAIAISPDGSTLAIVVNYPTGSLGGFMDLPRYDRHIQLYSLPDGKKKGNAFTDLGDCEYSNIWNIAFSPDGTELIFEKKHGEYGDDKDKRNFCVLSVEEGEIVRTKEMPQDPIMAISPHGDYVAATLKEQSEKVSIYTVSDFKLVRELSIPVTDWPELIFSTSGRAIAARTRTDDDQEIYAIRIWNLENGKEIYSGSPDLEYIQEYEQNDMITSFEVSTEGQTIYLGTQFGTINIMSAKSGKIEKRLGPLTRTNYSLTGNPGGVTSYDSPVMVKNILLGPDEKTLIVSEDLTVYGQTGSIHTYRLPAGEETHTLVGFSNGNENSKIAFSPDSSQIALVGKPDGTVDIYDTQNGQPVLQLSGHTQSVNQVAFSADSSMIATCSDDNTIRLWNAQTGSLLKILTGHEGRVNRIAFSPDSSWLASGADDNTIRRWSTDDGNLLETLELGDENWRVDLLDTLNGNNSIIYSISKYPSPYIGFIQKQVLWSTQNGKNTTIGNDNVIITQLDNGKEWFAGYSNLGRVVGKLEADGSMSILASFNSPYGNGALASVAILPESQLIISGNGFGLHAWKLAGSQLEFLDLVAASEPVPSYGYDYLFSPDGTMLAYTSGGVAYLMGIEKK